MLQEAPLLQNSGTITYSITVGVEMMKISMIRDSDTDSSGSVFLYTYSMSEALFPFTNL